MALLAGCGDGSDAGAGTVPDNAATGSEEPGRYAAGGDAGGGVAKADRDVELSGGERLVFFGDSLGVEGDPPYPDLLPDRLATTAPGVSAANVGEPGSTSADWLPEAALYEQRLAPELKGADVVLYTVGGNDLEAALGGTDGPSAAAAADEGAAARLFGAVERIERNSAKTARAIRRANPEARIVYVSYPDYSASERWQEAAGGLAIYGLGIGLRALIDGAEGSGADAVVDMLDVTEAAGVDSLLADREHLGPAGHRLYAEEIAAALGG